MGQDDKSKIPVGDHVLVSTGVRINQKGIFLVDDNENTNKAADHDFSKGKIVASVTLFGNIPTEYGGYFYGGGKEDRHGEIHTVLCEATFYASNLFYCNAKLFETIRTKRKN